MEIFSDFHLPLYIFHGPWLLVTRYRNPHLNESRSQLLLLLIILGEWRRCKLRHAPKINPKLMNGFWYYFHLHLNYSGKFDFIFNLPDKFVYISCCRFNAILYFPFYCIVLPKQT